MARKAARDQASHNQRAGRAGEDAAARWYEAQGYVIVDRNWRNEAGELDLVAARRPGRSRRSGPRQAAAVVFVEVKFRSSPRFGEAVLAVGWKKQERIRRLAGAWLSQQPVRFGSIRYDIVDVDGDETVTVYEDAF